MRFRLLTVFMMLALLAVAIPAGAQDADAFPVTIEHKFGTTTIPAAPQRVVSIGFTEQDFLLALGVTPLAVRYWYGDENETIRPWAQDLVEGEQPIVLDMQFGSLNYEAILELQPDLISAVTSGITEDEYNLLSQIAPTIAQSGEFINFGMPWQDATLMIGEAVGKSAEAEAIVADVEGLFADVRAGYPQFQGKSVAVSYFSGGEYGFYTDQDSRGRFFTELGFVVPQELIEIAGESFYSNLSLERVDLLDQELIAILNLQFIEGGREALEAEPLFSQLDAVREGRVVYFDRLAEDALGYSSPLSLAFAVDAVMPQLEAIFGAAETTETVSCADGQRLFDHEYLGSDPVCIPEAPQRIAVLDLAPLEVALIHGVEPVAMYTYGRDLIARSNPNINVDVIGMTANAGDVGSSGTPNLEVLLESHPDLIIASSFTANTAGFDILQEIAPTVLFAYPLAESEYRASVEFVSAVLGAPETGVELLGQLDARLAAFQAVMGDRLGTTDVSLVRLRESLILFVGGSFGDHLIHEAGLIRPEQQQEFDVDWVVNENDSWTGFEVTNENLPLVDADYVFIWTASPSAEVEAEAQGILATLLENPLWNTLQAAQDEHLFVVGSHWQGFGIFEAHAALDDLFRHIAGVDPQEVSPNPFLTAEPVIEATGEASGTSYPLSLLHSLGSVDLAAQPERIVALGSNDIATVYGLGLTPVAIAANPYAADGLWPWLEGIYDPAQTALISYQNPSFEQIIELNPDVILATDLFAIGDLYAELSQIAPTTAPVSESSLDMPWQEKTVYVGQVLGLPAEAQALVEETENQITTVVANHPEIAGKTFSLSFLYSSAAINSINAPTDFAVKFFQSLGFVVTPALAELAAAQEGVQAALSLETMNLIDADLVVLAFGSPEVQAGYESNPLYQAIPAVQDGRVVVVDLNTVTQLRGPNVLGIRWVLQQLEPTFAVLE